MQTLALPKPVFTPNSPAGFSTFSSAYLIKKKKKEPDLKSHLQDLWGDGVASAVCKWHVVFKQTLHLHDSSPDCENKGCNVCRQQLLTLALRILVPTLRFCCQF